MSGANADEEVGDQGLTLDSVKALIAEGRSGVRDELRKELEDSARAQVEAERKASRLEEIIAAQVKQIADLQSSKALALAPKAKLYCAYGSDGEGRGNAWPLRLRNERDRDVPHCYDLGEDHTYQSLTGANQGYKYEYRTLAALGSYLADFQLELGTILGDLRAEADPGLTEQAERLENTLTGAVDLASTRFGLIKELVSPDTTPQRKAFLQDKLYPREGVTGPVSSLTAWNETYDSAYAVQLEKQLAIEAARATAKSVGANSGAGGSGGGADKTNTRPTPRFAKARQGKQ